ncbi:MAG: GtrA family protein [Clostridiales bacterium]|nr:GtrA family protein [Clostridiales bacterium]
MKAKELFFGSDDLTAGQERLRELLMYPFAGVFTALANFLSFVIMDLILIKTINIDVFGYSYDLSLVVKQFVSWIVTILTAYATNSVFVFRNRGNHIRRLLAFAAARFSTFLVIEIALFSFMVFLSEKLLKLPKEHVLISLLGFNCTCLYVIKILNNIVLIAMNFIISKWIVFRVVNTDKLDIKEEDHV